jgi:acetyltransferase EpsM
MKKLFIIGTGSQARYVIENLVYDQTYSPIGMVDLENPQNIGKEVNGVAVVCMLDSIEEHFSPDMGEVIIAYGNNFRKREIARDLLARNYTFANIINPNSYLSSFLEIGRGCIFNPNVTIMPNATVGDHVILHSGCVIEHDNRLGDYVNFAPGVSTSGNVTIGEGSYIYTGATIIPNIRVGKWATVGAGANVINHVDDYAVVAGNPAKVIRFKEPLQD